MYRLIKDKESPELNDLRTKLSETQKQLELSIDKCQKAEEDATEKAEQVKFNKIYIFLSQLLGSYILLLYSILVGPTITKKIIGV